MTENEKGRVERAIHPWRWRALTAWVIAFSLIVGYALRIENRQSHRGNQAKTALCAYALSLRQQIDASRQYLDDVQTGVRKPIAGISNNDIVSGIRRQSVVLSSLSVLHCPLPRAKVIVP